MNVGAARLLRQVPDTSERELADVVRKFFDPLRCHGLAFHQPVADVVPLIDLALSEDAADAAEHPRVVFALMLGNMDEQPALSASGVFDRFAESLVTQPLR